MQLSFRIDKRPGESHLALDGKKTKKSKKLCTPLLWLSQARHDLKTWMFLETQQAKPMHGTEQVLKVLRFLWTCMRVCVPEQGWDHHELG